jgi:hypothetical protein
MKLRLVMAGLALSAFGLMIGYSMKSSANSEPVVSTIEPQSLNQCAAEAIASMKPAGVDIRLLRSITDLCYSKLHGQALLHDFQLRRLKFIQQTYDERILLWMVVTITVSGVGLAGLQLLTSYRLAASGTTGADHSSEFVIQRDRIALKSSVTGLFVLLLSFGFFYVFVYEIYVIKEIDVGTAARREIANEQIESGTLEPLKRKSETQLKEAASSSKNTNKTPK